MNFHTFELYYKLSPSEVFKIKDILWQAPNGAYRETDKGIPTLVSKTLSDYGIVIKIKQYSQDAYKHNILYYRINPRRMFESGNYVGIFNSKHADILISKFNSLVNSVSYMLPEFDSCKFNRIDYCSNIEMSSQDEINIFIDLLKRGYLPPKYNFELYDNKKAKKKTLSKNGITISGSNGIKITYYNKYRQLKEKHSTYPDITRANKIIRAEISCDKKKIRQLVDHFGCTKASSFLKESDKIGKYVFDNFANICYGSGDFYKLTDVYTIIGESSFKEKTKRKMKELAKMSGTHSSLHKAFDELGYTQKDKKAILKKFNKIVVSPVVIPRRCKFDNFKNPLSLALKWSDYDDLF